MTAQSVWITGARGFIGRHLAKECASRGMYVSGVGHTAWSQQEAAGWGISAWIHGGVTLECLDRLAKGAPAPNVVFHLAGGSSVGASLAAPAEDFRRSVDSTSQVLEWVRTNAPDATVVLASSAAVYGTGHRNPIREGDPCHPWSPYGGNKRLAELLCEQYSTQFHLATGAVRMFSVYGPELRKQLLWDLCMRLCLAPDVLTLSGTGEERRDLVNVVDAVSCLLRCAERVSVTRGNHVVNCGTGVGVTVREVAQALIAAWGMEIPVAFTGQPRSGDPTYLVAAVERACEYGWSSRVGWRSGLEQYVTWFRNAGVTVPA